MNKKSLISIVGALLFVCIGILVLSSVLNSGTVTEEKQINSTTTQVLPGIGILAAVGAIIAVGFGASELNKSVTNMILGNESERLPPQEPCKEAKYSLIALVLNLCIPVLSSIAAIVLGIIALKKIKESRGRLTGIGMALSSIALGSVFSLGFILVIATGLLLPSQDRTIVINFIQAANENDYAKMDSYLFLPMQLQDTAQEANLKRYCANPKYIGEKSLSRLTRVTIKCENEEYNRIYTLDGNKIYYVSIDSNP